jgi:hypothetical protein
VLAAPRRPSIRNLLDDSSRRGGNGLQLRPHGSHNVRTPGNMGGFAPWLAPKLAGGQLCDPEPRSPHRPVVAS